MITSKDANGAEVKDTVTYKEAMYDIYTVETQYNSMNSLYQQYYGSSYWEATNVDSKGRTGAQAAKKEVMDTLKQREILCLEAEKNGVALTAAEKKTADENVTSTLKNMSDAQKKMQAFPKKKFVVRLTARHWQTSIKIRLLTALESMKMRSRQV